MGADSAASAAGASGSSMPWTQLAGMGLSLAGQQQMGAANQSMGMAQQNAAGSEQNMAMGAVAPTPASIQNMQQMTDTAQSNLQRQQAVLASADPAMISLGQQTLAMMNGQRQVGTNAVLQTNINQARNNMQRQLQQQLGPGWAQSTAGQQAMQQFELNASNSLQSNQQNTINQNMGILGGISQQGLGQSYGMFQGIGQQNLAQQQQSLGAILGTQNNVVSNAGAPYIGASNAGSSLAGMAPYASTIFNAGKSLWGGLSGVFSGAGAGATTVAGGAGDAIGGLGAGASAGGGAADVAMLA